MPRSEMDISDSSPKQEDVEVDIMECGNQRDGFQEEADDLCQASSSSSFGDSMCARDDDDDSSFGNGEDEAQSMLSKDYPLPDGTDLLGITKKKLTDRWRRFSMPLAWRLKWLELKVKEIESQAKGYEKELENYYDTKMFDLEKSRYEGLEGKSIPFRHQTQRMKAFKRGRRKRFEDTTDVKAYRANHNIFSYADKRMPVALKPQFLDLDFGRGRKATCKEGVPEDDCLVSEFDCADALLAEVLCAIDEAQEKARGLKKRMDQLMLESQIDLTQNGEQLSMPHQRVAEQTRRQHVPPNTKDILKPQTPPFQIGGQCFNNKAPVSPGFLGFDAILEDLLMVDETDMNDDETGMDDESFDHFQKLMDEITGVPQVSPEEADAEEDPTPVTKRRKTSR